MTERWLPLLLLVSVSLACREGGDATPTPVATEQFAITTEQLALMPLSDTELGVDPESLQVSEDSGYLTSNQLAGDTIDPYDTAADIEAMGWLATYSLDYEDPTLTTAPGFQDGGTSLDLFRDTGSAVSFLEKQLEDPGALAGEIFLGGLGVRESSSFAVQGGDQGFGLKAKLRAGDVSANNWIAGFRIGQLIAAVRLTRIDDADSSAQMQDLVTKLEQRVRDVLTGSSQAAAIPLPTIDPEAPGQASRPNFGPFPDEMALTLSDLPRGSTVDEEGYVPREGRIEYERHFDLGPGAGEGGPFSVQSNLELLTDDFESASRFESYSDVFLGRDSLDFFQGILDSQPFEVSNIDAEERGMNPAGDGSFRVAVTYDMPIGAVENEFVYVRVGRVIGALLFSGFDGEIGQGLVNELMARFVQKIEAELASG